MLACLWFFSLGDAQQFVQETDRFIEANGNWAGVTYIADVRVVPMTEEGPLQLEHRDVWIRDGVIVTIAPHKGHLGASIESIRGVDVIDGRGLTLIPGLIDTHVHIWMGDGRYPYFDQYDLWTLYLTNGITTVMEMIGATLQNQIRYFLFDWRDEVAEGATVGPTLFVVSPRFRDEYQPTFAAIDRAVETYAEAGFDAIKVHAPNKLPNYLRLFEQAQLHDIKPIGHPPYRSPDVPLETVVELQTMICHTQLIMWQAYGLGNTFISNQQMEGIADLIASHGNWIQPTLFTNAIFYLHLEPDYWEERSQAEWLQYFPQPLVNTWINQNDIRSNSNYTLSGQRAYWNALIEQTRLFYQRGIPMLAGSDAGGIHLTPHGFMMVDELTSFQNDIGLTPWESLQTATVNNARWLGIDHLVGTVEVGKRADLVLLRANPLDDVAAVAEVEMVFSRGKGITRNQLDIALQDLAQRVSQAKTHPIEPMIERHCDHLSELPQRVWESAASDAH